MILQALLFGLGLGGAGALSLVGARRVGRELSRLRDTPTTLVGSLVEGPAEVTGRAVPIRHVRATWSGTDSAVVKYLVEERRSSGKHSHWVTVKHWTEPDPMRFLVDDSTGKALVQAEVADVDAPTTFTAESRLGKDPPEAVLATLREKGIGFEGLFGANKHMRFTELALPSGTNVFIEGYALVADAAKDAGTKYALTRGPDDELLVTTRSEDDETKRLARRRAGLLAGGIGFTIVGALLALFGLIGSVGPAR